MLSNFQRRLGSTLTLWGLILGVIIFDWEPGYAMLIPAVGGLALWEFYMALDHAQIRAFKRTGTIAGVLYLLASWLFLSQTIPNPGQPLFELVCLQVTLLGVLAREVFSKDRKAATVTMAVTVFGVLYIPWLFNFVTHLLYYPEPAGSRHPALVLYLLLVTKLTDIGAYVTGSLLGKHKLAPNVSPKKTWEGFFGGVALSALSSWLLVTFLPDQLSLIPQKFSLLIGVLIALASVVGDLAESVVKRDVQIKDSGGFIPGIGGALDLIDSILFTAPMLYLMLRIIRLPALV